jgi:hypothetical protein
LKTTIFIPETIKVGFQNRNGTYTGKLAYIIYYDQKGVLRKETSWNGWRDKSIPDLTVSNEPTSGFVLNKKAGGYDTGWNHRQTYVRVYDPRDFEFEISVPNLLYILENTNSIKGKGLDGEFVYGWDGKELILIPTSSPDYIEISEFNKILHEKNYVKAKELKLGATYRTKDNEEWIYMGRFDYHVTESERVEKRSNNHWSGYTYDYIYKNVNKGKHHFFARESTDWKDNPYLKLLTLKSLGQKFIGVVNEECVENYADLFDKLECKTEYSPHDKTRDEYINYTFDEFEKYITPTINHLHYWHTVRFMSKKEGGHNNEEIRYDKDLSLFYINGDYNRETRSYEKTILGSIEDVFNTYQPVYKNEYLENGKLYRRVN